MVPLIVLLTLGLFFTVGSSLGLIACAAISIVLVVAANVVLSRVLDRGIDTIVGIKGESGGMGRQVASIVVSLAILGYFWWSDGSVAAGSRPEGKSVVLQVGGRPHTFTGAYARHDSFLGNNWLFEVDADETSDGEGTLSFGFFCAQSRIEDLKGQALRANYAEENPQCFLLGECWNYFRSEGKYFQGHNVGLSILAVTAKEVTLSVDAEYLEFASDQSAFDEEGNPTTRGTPVKVSGTLTVPIEREDAEE